MRAKTLRRFELLEARHALSGAPVLSHFLASDAIAPASAISSSVPAPSAPVAPESAAMPAAVTLSERFYLASTPSAPNVPTANNWDWLANTVWYVPTGNLLAYAMLPDLTHIQAVGDQTVWHITSCSDGQFAGNGAVQLSINPSTPSPMTFTGFVTEGGQIQFTFINDSSGAATTGVGQMRFINGAWAVEMQMATGSTVLISHWAYMIEQTPGITPPGPGTSAPSENYLNTAWKWLQGTHWTITDTSLFGGQSASGVFEIDGYSSGYFWGSGTGSGSTPFNVFGSVTPEGNLLLLISVNGAPAVGRMGVVEQTSTGTTMTFRSYTGPPSLGSAWTLSTPSDANLRSFLASS
jgi:hypothetical protein